MDQQDGLVGKKVLPATLCHQSSVPRTYMME